MAIPPLHGLERFEEDLPHVRWPTFLDGWNQNKRAFYYEMLGEAMLSKCRCGVAGSMHILGVDGNKCSKEMNTARLKQIVEQIKEKMSLAISKSNFVVSPADRWGLLGPSIPAGLRGMAVKPKLMAYSMNRRMVLIVNVTVRWETRIANTLLEPQFERIPQHYQETVNYLRNNDFKVEFKNIEIGCRGAFSGQLYTLFHETFQMRHADIEAAMMDISKGILSCPYEKFYQCHLN